VNSVVCRVASSSKPAMLTSCQKHPKNVPIDKLRLSMLKSQRTALPLGGRPTVGLQTLDLPIGVRIPASQPIILKDFLKLVGFEPDSPLRLHCGLSRRGQAIKLVHERDVGPRNQMSVDVHRHLDGAMPHLIPHVSEGCPRLCE